MLSAYFNRFGGAPTIFKSGEGSYRLTFPGLEGKLVNSLVIHIATLFSTNPGEIRVTSASGNPLVLTSDSAGTAADRGFYYTVLGTNLAP